MNYKTCSKCERELPATNEYFHTDNSTTDKLRNACKQCVKVMDSERNAKNRRENGDVVRTRARFKRRENREHYIKMDRKSYNKNIFRKREQKRESRYAYKIAVLMHYGCKCTVCGEDNPAFLSIDHVNNDGAKQRRCKNTRTTTQFHKWIIENNYPKDLQVLCYNCNLEKEIIYKSGRNKQSKSINKQRDRYKAVKIEVMNHYGGKCSCCGETNINKLTMDHINGGGLQQYKEIGVSQLYRWIRKNNFPPNFQVLCMNCNLAKYNYGVCPHSMNGLGSMTPDVEKLYVDFVNRLGIERSIVTDPRLSIGTNEMSFNLLHASMGLVTEAAEVIDLLKKHLAYDRSFDRQKILSEISDIWFYVTMMLIDQKSSYKEIIDLNMKKLLARYPGGYSHHAANNRNLEVEDQAMGAIVNETNAQETATNVNEEPVVKGSEKDDRFGPYVTKVHNLNMEDQAMDMDEDYTNCNDDDIKLWTE